MHYTKKEIRRLGPITDSVLSNSPIHMAVSIALHSDLMSELTDATNLEEFLCDFFAGYIGGCLGDDVIKALNAPEKDLPLFLSDPEPWKRILGIWRIELCYL